MLGAAIIGALSLLIILTVILITVLLIRYGLYLLAFVATEFPCRCARNVSMKAKPRPLPVPKRQRKRDDEGGEELEMKGVVTSEQQDDDYYFEDTSNIGTLYPLIFQTTFCSCCGAVTGRNSIPMADFPAHVRQMHLDGDWKLELEYKVYNNNYCAKYYSCLNRCCVCLSRHWKSFLSHRVRLVVSPATYLTTDLRTYSPVSNIG